MLSWITPLISNLLLGLWLVFFAVAWWLTRRQQQLRKWIFFGGALLWFLAARPVVELFAWPLEGRFAQPTLESLKSREVQQVVVLTGGGWPVQGALLGSAFPTGSTYRFMGGIELCAHLGPNCRLIFSGSAGRGSRDLATAEIMQRLSSVLDHQRPTAAEAQSGSTAEHPKNVAPLLQKGPFALVTSAYHMPRAVRSFRRAGLEPIPFPVDQLAYGHYTLGSWLPSVDSLRTLQILWREYLAWVLYGLKGW